MLAGAEFKFLNYQSNDNWDIPRKKDIVIAKRKYIFYGLVLTISFSCKANNLVKILKKLLTYMKILKINNLGLRITYTSVAFMIFINIFQSSLILQFYPFHNICFLS